MLSLAYEVQRGCYSIFSHHLWRKKATDDLFSPVIIITIIIIIIIIIIIMEFSVAFPRGGSSSTVFRSNWNLEVLIFVEGGKPENPEKNPRSRDQNQQQTQPTCDAGSGNRTRATAVGGECSHHCAIPVLLI